MVSKSTTLIVFRFSVRYIGLLNDELRCNNCCRTVLCRHIFKRAHEVLGNAKPPLKKLLFYDKVRRDRAHLSGKSEVFAVRVTHELALNIRAMAQRDGNNISEWCGLMVLKWLNEG